MEPLQNHPRCNKCDCFIDKCTCIESVDPKSRIHKGKKYNDSGWLKYGYDYDDENLQTYFEEPIIKVRFYENKEGASFYDVILLSDLSKNEQDIINIEKFLCNLPIMTIREKKALSQVVNYLTEELEEVKDFIEKGEPETHIEKSVRILTDYLVSDSFRGD